MPSVKRHGVNSTVKTYNIGADVFAEQQKKPWELVEMRVQLRKNYALPANLQQHLDTRSYNLISPALPWQCVEALSLPANMKMKNLAIAILTVMTFAIGTINVAFPDTPSEDTSWIKRGSMDRWSKPGSKHSDAEANRLLRSNSQVFAYVPGDIKSAGEPPVRCDQNGIRTESSGGYCVDYHSASKRTSWKIRYERGGRIDRVFKYAGYKNKYSSLNSWVVFNTDAFSPHGSVSFASPAAKQTLPDGEGTDRSFDGVAPVHEVEQQ